MSETVINRSEMSDEEYMEALEDAVSLLNAQSAMLGIVIETMGDSINMLLEIAEISADQNRNLSDMIDDMFKEAELTAKNVDKLFVDFREAMANGASIH